MLSFGEFLAEQKDLSKASHDDYLEHVSDVAHAGEKEIKTVAKTKILPLPDTNYVSHDGLKKVLGEPTKTPLGNAWHYNYKGAVVELSHNSQLGRHQLTSREEHMPLLKELRTRFVQAYDKKHPGTIDKIEKSFSAVAGKGSYK